MKINSFSFVWVLTYKYLNYGLWMRPFFRYWPQKMMEIRKIVNSVKTDRKCVVKNSGKKSKIDPKKCRFCQNFGIVLILKNGGFWGEKIPLKQIRKKYIYIIDTYIHKGYDLHVDCPRWSARLLTHPQALSWRCESGNSFWAVHSQSLKW